MNDEPISLTQLADRLVLACPPHVHVVAITGRRQPDHVLQRLSRLRIAPHLWPLRGARMGTSEDLMAEVAVGLPIAHDFGDAWAALHDALLTMEVQLGQPQIIVLRDAERILPADGRLLAALLFLMSDASRWWAEPFDGERDRPPTPMHVIVLHPRPAAVLELLAASEFVVAVDVVD